MPLSQYLRPDLSAARVARVWGRVEQGLPPARPARRWAAWALAVSGAVAVLLGLGLLARGRWAGSVLENASLETAGDTLAVTLLDGSELKLASRTRVQVAGDTAQAVTLQVAHGQISCDVTHRPGRTFVVRASGVEVRVVGTRFSVSDEQRSDGGHVEVTVERGVVEVLSAQHPGQISRVAAGQSFSEWVPLQVPPGVSGASGSVAAPGFDSAAVPPLDSAVPAALDSAVPAALDSAVPPLDSAKSASIQHSVPDDGARAAREPDARALLDAANTARRAGDARAAADAYGQLLRKFPGDGRAGLAAFELGRLRMDRLGDWAGAVQALERAVQLAPGSGFREDAMARLVKAYGASGRGADCRRSRDAYLAAFPAGLQRDAVSRACAAH